MTRQTHFGSRGPVTLLTAALASLLVACGGGEDASPDAVTSDPPADAIADDSELDSSGGAATLTLGDETFVFPVETCVNPGGGTFVFGGSATSQDGKTVEVMVRGVTGQNQAFITIGPPGSDGVLEWRGGTKTTSASIDGGVLTASGEAVGLDSILSPTGQTRTFSVSGPCVG